MDLIEVVFVDEEDSRIPILRGTLEAWKKHAQRAMELIHTHADTDETPSFPWHLLRKELLACVQADAGSTTELLLFLSHATQHTPQESL